MLSKKEVIIKISEGNNYYIKSVANTRFVQSKGHHLRNTDKIMIEQ